MARTRVNPLVGELDGKIGNLVFYHRKGTPCVRRRPVRKKKFTSKEKKNQSRFAQAARFASSTLTDPAQRRRYEAAAQGTHSTPQNAAVSDYLHPPQIVEIDSSGYTGRVGSRIRVRAQEGQLGAVAVRITIADRSKTTLEEGDAQMEPDGFWWSYTAQKTLNADEALWLIVTAYDQPGNKTTQSVPLAA